MTTTAETLPCGCIIDTVGDAFVMQPCSPGCEFYRYALEQSAAQGKPVTYITDPTAELRDLLADDASTFPDGHPCRACDRLYKDHPHPADDQCEGWR